MINIHRQSDTAEVQTIVEVVMALDHELVDVGYDNFPEDLLNCVAIIEHRAQRGNVYLCDIRKVVSDYLAGGLDEEFETINRDHLPF